MTAQTRTQNQNATSVDGTVRGSIAVVNFGVGAPITAVGGAELASGLVNGDPVLLLVGTVVLALGGANLALGVLNGIEAVARRTAHLIRHDISPLERR